MNLDKLTWYVSRSGGIVAWTLLALSLILGLLLSSRILGRKASPAWTLSVHRFLGGLSVLFTGVHVAAIMLDGFVDFGVAEVLVPWASSWRPSAVAWGIVAMYLMVAIELTSFAMNRLPKKLWRWVHWTSAPLFAFASLHGYQAGTDTGRAFILAILGVIVVLALLTVLRVARSRRTHEKRTDPRTLLEQAKNRPAMRAEPPIHVLDALTLSQPAPEVAVVEERELVSVGGRSKVERDGHAGQNRNLPPKSRRRGPADSSSLSDALPPVPWTPPEPAPPVPVTSSGVPAASSSGSSDSPASPDPWPESFFGGPTEPTPSATPTPTSKPGVRPAEAATQPNNPTPQRREERREPAMSGAPRAQPAFGIEPPKPAWAEPAAEKN